MKVFFWFSLTLFSSCFALSAATFYVDTGGNDQSNGSLAAPWATINYALGQVQAGDSVWVNGGTYAEKVSFVSSGTAGNPIILVGDSLNRPFIDGTGLVPNGREGLIGIVDQSYIEVLNFELGNFQTANTATPVGILVEGAAHDIAIRNCRITAVNHLATSDDRGANAIGVYGTDANTAIYNLLLDQNDVTACSTLASEVITLNGNVRDFEVAGNRVFACTNIGIDFIGWEGECSGCTAQTGPNVDRARDGWVHDNLVFEVDTKDNPAYNGERNAAGIYVDGGADILIERNIVHSSNLGIELASEHFGQATERIIVRSNLIYNNHLIGIATGGYDPGTGPGGGSAIGCWIVQNTLYQNHSSNRPQDDFDGEIRLQNRNIDMTFANNIVYASPNRPRVVIAGGNQVYSFAGMAYFGSTAGLDPGAVVQADPLMVSPSVFFFALTASSPCLDAGVALTDSIAGLQDYAGDPRRRGSQLDIGAYEYPLATSAPTATGPDISLQLFPNPSDHFLHLRWFSPAPPSALLVFDALGRLVPTQWLPEGSQGQILDVSGLPSGVYWLVVTGENGRVTRRWVRE